MSARENILAVSFDCITYLYCKIQYFLSFLLIQDSVEKAVDIRRLSLLSGNKLSQLMLSCVLGKMDLEWSMTREPRLLFKTGNQTSIKKPHYKSIAQLSFGRKHRKAAFFKTRDLFCYFLVLTWKAAEHFFPPKVPQLFCLNLPPWMPHLPMSHLGSLQTSMASDLVNRYEVSFLSKIL